MKCLLISPTPTQTNLWQGDLETEVDGTKGDLTETETESNEALSEWEEGRNVDFLARTGLNSTVRRAHSLHETSVCSLIEQFDVVSSYR